MKEDLKTYLDTIEKERINELHNDLFKVKQDFIDHTLKDNFHGICINKPWDTHALSEILNILMTYWSEYSGEPRHPVPSFEEWVSPHVKYMNTDDKWDQDTEYGKARVRLLNWMIDELSEYLKDE